jgi:hypothetical protein
MNSLTAPELLDTPFSSAGAMPEPSMRALVRRSRPDPRSRAQQIFGGFVAVSIQAVFLAGLAYGTMRELMPSLESITVVNILDETPVVEEMAPPPPPKFEQPVIHMQTPLVTITQPEPAPAAPTATVSDRPSTRTGRRRRRCAWMMAHANV